MSGIVVYIGKPVDCPKCKGTGLQALGFVHGPNGAICTACNGVKLTHEALPIEEFAKLFTYGQSFSMAAMRGEEAPTNEIRVAAQRQSAAKGER